RLNDHSSFTKLEKIFGNELVVWAMTMLATRCRPDRSAVHSTVQTRHRVRGVGSRRLLLGDRSDATTACQPRPPGALQSVVRTDEDTEYRSGRCVLQVIHVGNADREIG